MDEKQLCCLSIAHAGVFFVLFPFLSKVSMAAGFACLVFVAVSGACSIGPKTAIVHQVSAGPSQVVAMPFYNRCDRAVYALGAGSPWYARVRAYPGKGCACRYSMLLLAMLGVGCMTVLSLECRSKVRQWLNLACGSTDRTAC